MLIALEVLIANCKHMFLWKYEIAIWKSELSKKLKTLKSKMFLAHANVNNIEKQRVVVLYIRDGRQPVQRKKMHTAIVSITRAIVQTMCFQM